MRQVCNFCSKFGLHFKAAEPYDEILFESSNFVAVPTRGSIIPGWLLIIPRVHFLCVGAFSPEMMREFTLFRHRVASALENAFGPVACFEHGPATPCTSIGCGVDHAHLHVVATKLDLRQGAARISAGGLAWVPVNRLSTLSHYHAEGLAYLYLEQFGKSWICSPEIIESQLFRKVIATAVREPQKYKWNRHSFIPEVVKTLWIMKHGDKVACVPTDCSAQ